MVALEMLHGNLELFRLSDIAGAFATKRRHGAVGHGDGLDGELAADNRDDLHADLVGPCANLRAQEEVLARFGHIGVRRACRLSQVVNRTERIGAGQASVEQNALVGIGDVFFCNVGMHGNVHRDVGKRRRQGVRRAFSRTRRIDGA